MESLWLSLAVMHGSGPGHLNRPYGITIGTAATSLVYVSEMNHRVSVFTSDGGFVSNFGKKGSKFNNPIGLTFDRKHLYVCDLCNNRLAVY